MLFGLLYISELQSQNELAPVLGVETGKRSQSVGVETPRIQDLSNVRGTNVLKVILYYIVIILKVTYRVFICVSVQIAVMPRRLFASPFE
jgi:hypothetical protein